ncbi:hypothetical protein BD779DRAFT_1673110 [Infundibulicybe gibba]|nr:hypothetical protein BD779DRAFT_1673110 [Infundibulicybe gibba]
MNSTVSNFFSRDAFLKRQVRMNRSHKAPETPMLHLSSSLKGKSLHIIPEEEEELRKSSSSRSPSPRARSPMPTASGSQSLGVKAKRRQANVTVSDIRIARSLYVRQADDISSQDEEQLLSSPRPAPRPPTTSSPTQSPDSFRLTFPDASFKFPHPPVLTPSYPSTHDQRPSSASPTPSMSTSGSSSPCSQVGGLPVTPSSSDDEFTLEVPSRPFNYRRASIKPLIIAKHNTPSPSPLDDSPISASLLQPFKNEHESVSVPRMDTPDSESESDSEWYTQELSQILSLYSPLPPAFPHQEASRPESISIPDNKLFLDAPLSPPAKHSAPSATIRSPGVPSGQLDPAFPRRRRSHSRSIPKHPPPPVPPIPAHFRALSNSPGSHSSSATSSPSSSPTKATTTRPTRTLSVRRPPPRSSIPADCAFDDDESSCFSLSLYQDEPEVPSPGSVYSQPSFNARPEDLEFPADDFEFDLDIDVPMRLPLSLPGTPIDLEADIASGLEELRLREAQPPVPVAEEDSRALRSRWSSSTLSSMREEQERRSGGASKLRLYFGGGSPSKTKRGSASSAHKKATPPTPTSPSKKFRQSYRESDVMIIGHQGIRRRPSVTASVSDAGSDESGASASSGGLRRKPIPVEMFLRTAAV